MKIKRLYEPYWNWEDYINGMWLKLEKHNEADMLYQAVQFTSNWIEYGNAMGEVIKAWPITMRNSLTNLSINRRAFLGHCACSYKFNCPEYITRQAWHIITEQQRIDADRIAESHIKKYEREIKKIYSRLGEKLLF